MKMALPRYPRQSGAHLRGFGAFGQQEGPCYLDTNGQAICPPGYTIGADGRVEQETNWQPLVQASTGLVLAIVNAATGKQYTYPNGQQPTYQVGANYSPPWYESIPTWAWLVGGGLLVGLAYSKR